MNRFQTIAATLIALGLHSAAPCQPAEGPGGQPGVASREFFVQQQANEAIVVRVSAYEAEFITRAATIEGEALGEAGPADVRMLPIFQFVPEAGKARQIDIDVTATQVTDRTEFALELTRLNIRDNRSARMAYAYRLLSAGLEHPADDKIPAWTVKTDTLLQAAGLFSELGMEEMRQWCHVYAAHHVLYRLRDVQTALDWANQVLRVNQIERYPLIAFAAARLRSTAMARQAGAPGSSSIAVEQANEDTLRRARALGFRYEEALALQAGAVGLKAQGRPGPALERLNEALGIAEQIGAADLAAAIREHIVAIHEEFGDTEASGLVLQDIESHLRETGDVEQLAVNLLRQGRLLIESHHYPEAVAVLSRAIELEQSDLNRIQAHLALGSALDASGRHGEALWHFHRGVAQPGSGEIRRPSPMLDIAAALDAMATIHRHRGEFERMNGLRAAQRDHAASGAERARWSYARAVDQLFQHGLAAQSTRAGFEEAWRAGDSAGRSLSLLRLCSLDRDDSRCRPAGLQSAFEEARTTGSASQAAEATMVYVGLLESSGEIARALATANEQLGLLGSAGTESLGAWYWHWRQTMFDAFMAVAIRNEGSAAGAGRQSLLTLAKARRVDRRGGAAQVTVDPAQVTAYLNALPPGSAMLTYYFGRDAAWAWVGSSDGVRRITLGEPAAIRALCIALRASVESGSWAEFERLAERLGQALVAPLTGLLPDRIYLLAHGDVLGIPFDALSRDGRPLLADHVVSYLDEWPGGTGAAESMQVTAPTRVFLAGDPQDWSGDYATRLDPSAELRAVSDRFLGPGLHTVQGVALLLDEFADPRLAGAQLVHLALPGMIDLSAVHASGLVLSEAARGEGRQSLDDRALARQPLAADLVFMSRTTFRGAAGALENRVDLASTVLDGGAGAVIASLWDIDPQVRAAFVAEFYDRLTDAEPQTDLAGVLAATRRAFLDPGNHADWAGFFLMTR